MKIKVLHWNILADSLTDGFDGVTPEHLTWQYRLPLVVEIIRNHDPDVIALQEVELAQFTDLKKAFPLYYGIYAEKMGDGSDDTHGTAIFVSREMQVTSYAVHRLLGGKIFTSVLINDKMLIGACHLKAKEGYEAMRLREVHEILNLNVGVKQQINVGDFNDVPTSLCIAKMCKHYNLYHPTFTTHKSRNGEVKKRVIDYIFFRNVVETNGCANEPTALLPNAQFPSDHVPLVGTFICS